MLRFNNQDQLAYRIGRYYAEQLGNPLFTEYMAGESSLTSKEEARKVAELFWAMTDLSIADNEAEKEICGTKELEFWMIKLFNKVSGDFIRSGYEQIWYELSDAR